jgi:hypothetical protein
VKTRTLKPLAYYVVSTVNIYPEDLIVSSAAVRTSKSRIVKAGSAGIV